MSDLFTGLLLTRRIFLAFVYLLKGGLWVLLLSNLRITVVLVKEFEMGVSRCWASVPEQVCQLALLSVQSFLIFWQGS